MCFETLEIIIGYSPLFYIKSEQRTPREDANGQRAQEGGLDIWTKGSWPFRKFSQRGFYSKALLDVL